MEQPGGISVEESSCDAESPDGAAVNCVRGGRCQQLGAQPSSWEIDRDNTSAIPAVQVCVRIRPILGWEQAHGHKMLALRLEEGAGGSVTLPNSERNDRPSTYRFNNVFGPGCSQENIWNAGRLADLVCKVVEGFHVAVFAYGQTGSGKTHTMEGFVYQHHNGSAPPSSNVVTPKVSVQETPPGQLGIVPRAINELFRNIEQKRVEAAELSFEETFRVKVSFLQIYNERIFDLLNPVLVPVQREGVRSVEGTGLRLRWDGLREQFIVENLFEYECSSAQDVLNHYAAGVRNKNVASTAMNVASSRSHTILVLTLVRQTRLDWTDDRLPNSGRSVREVTSKLSLVDLAGSERASPAADSEPCSIGKVRFKEAVNINQSLFVLRKVITALCQKFENRGDSGHIPYRESKLTSLLQHSLGGNGFMLMLACLAPSDKYQEENLSTLQYASQAACIKNRPVVNLDPKDKLLQQMRLQLEAAHTYILRTCGLAEIPDELINLPGFEHKSKRRVASRSVSRSSSVPRAGREAERGRPASVPRSRQDVERNSPNTSLSVGDGRDHPRKAWAKAGSVDRCRSQEHAASEARDSHHDWHQEHSSPPKEQRLNRQVQQDLLPTPPRTGLPPIAPGKHGPRSKDPLDRASIPPTLLVYCESLGPRRAKKSARSSRASRSPSLPKLRAESSSPRGMGRRSVSASAIRTLRSSDSAQTLPDTESDDHRGPATGLDSVAEPVDVIAASSPQVATFAPMTPMVNVSSPVTPGMVNVSSYAVEAAAAAAATSSAYCKTISPAVNLSVTVAPGLVNAPSDAGEAAAAAASSGAESEVVRLREDNFSLREEREELLDKINTLKFRLHQAGISLDETLVMTQELWC